MRPPAIRRVVLSGVLGILVTACLATLVLDVPEGRVVPAPDTVPAADTSQFTPGNIITDEVFFAGEAMAAAEVDAFIGVKGGSCVAGSDGTPCLKDFRMDTAPRSPDSYCSGYVAGRGETAGAIIAQTARSCGVSPRVLLVVLQKEQGLVTGSRHTAVRYQKAMGFACPDTAPCDTAYYGFQNQVYAAARQYKVYAANPTRYAYRAGRQVNVLYNPNHGCGSSPVTIANQATAGLYIYTPYQPNAAALAAGYRTGDACSAYGNRNFWLYFTDWFGSTQYDAVAATLPKGSVDAVSSSYGQVTVSGWALDPDASAQSLEVHVYVDGRSVVASKADLSRPDVADAYPGAGSAHGYSVTFPYALGNHQVCVYALNIGAGRVNPQVGCRVVDNQDPGAPIGSLDAVVSEAPNSIGFAGWAFDQDSRSATLAVHVYVDGKLATALPADASRPDVAAVHGVNPEHGYSGRVDTVAGEHEVCAFAINTGLGVTNPNLGCARVLVHGPAHYNPRSALDEVSATGGTVRLKGWAYDSDAPGEPVALHVYVDGRVVEQVRTADPRPDVARVSPDAGPTSGYRWEQVVAAGQHQACVFAINVGHGDSNPLVGCRQFVTVGGSAANPAGALDVVSTSPGMATVAGWGYDVDRPAEPIAVHVYVDGRSLAAVNADGERPDVARALGADVGSRHGFTWSGALSTGRHEVCVYAINVGAGSGNPLLGCRTVSVPDPATVHDPVGSVDGVTVRGSVVDLAGWALDPNLGEQPVAVHLYVDGALATAFRAAGPRPDVGAAYPASGDAHGFTWSGSLAPGQRNLCVFAINEGEGTGTNPLLGCRTVRVG